MLNLKNSTALKSKIICALTLSFDHDELKKDKAKEKHQTMKINYRFCFVLL